MFGKIRVLVVDDNKEFCQNVVDILGLKGYEVVVAHNGVKALDILKQNGFALALLDIKMPAMDGVATFKKMKKIAPDTAVIMITAYAVEELVREALQEGAFGFLRKPLDFDELFKIIERVTGSGAMILVVDDDRNLCAGMKDVLEGKGYRVCVAYDGNMAIEKAEKNNFDIMLIDMKMPVLNGLETYITIRDFRPNIVAIVITGYLKEMNKLVEQTLQQNAYACLEKPIDMDKLVLLLERIKEHQDNATLKKSDDSSGHI